MPQNDYQSDRQNGTGTRGEAWIRTHERWLAVPDTYRVTVPYRAHGSAVVSVVIPIYNVEAYVERCLKSITGQTLRELQIICVLDGSEDGSGDIARRFAQQDPRIMVIEQQNMGQSAARNHGLAEARAPYVYFMDGDDELDMNALETLTRFAQENNLDAVLFDADCIYEEDGCGAAGTQAAIAEKTGRVPFGVGNYHRVGTYPQTCTGIELLGAMRSNREFSPSVPLQLSRREHLVEHYLAFHRGVIHEDNAFTTLNLAFAERAGYLRQPFFKRRIRPGSTMTRQEAFDNAYGYHTAYLDVCARLPELEQTHGTDVEPVYESALRFLKSAREIQARIPEEERQIYKALPDPERFRYAADVADPAEWKTQLTERQQKLQKTYDEKYDRGVRIKELEHEVEKRDATIDALKAGNAKLASQNSSLRNELQWHKEHYVRAFAAGVKKKFS